MNTPRQHRLIEIEWPEFGTSHLPPQPTLEEYDHRLAATRAAMDQRGLSHLVVYGDREHFANLAYLTGFDPRYEEALLIIGPGEKPLIVVGNECEAYLPVSPPYAAGRLRAERFQPFSLLNQPRDSSRLLKDILSGEGVGAGSRVGCVGWKYFAASEHPAGAHTIDLPAYLVDTLRDLAGREHVVNATDIFMHPDYGLRTVCSPAEIACFEYTNSLASDGMRRVLFGLREGMRDYDVFRLYGYDGEPMGCHPTLVTGANLDRPLGGPVGAVIRRGEPMATNICYWGSNCCRAGWIASSPCDLPPPAQDYVEQFAGPYVEAVAAWFGLLTIGRRGDELARLIDQRLPFDRFSIFLNPGHLIHLDEWVSSPIYRGSNDRIHSGMAIQVDIIPSSPVYFSTRMEDGIVIADADLRRRLQQEYPDCFARCLARRDFMINTLGFDLPQEILPLSNMPGIVPPFFLSPTTVIGLEQ
jgi:hypothetical protein